MNKIIIKTDNAGEIAPLIYEALDREQKILKIEIEKTKEILNGFEKKYRRKTNQFYKTFIKGKSGDSSDFIEWAGEKEVLYKTA